MKAFASLCPFKLQSMDVIWFARTKNCLQCQQVNWQDEKCANCAIKTFIFSLKILLLHIFNLYHFVDATHSQNGENENERKPERARKKRERTNLLSMLNYVNGTSS